MFKILAINPGATSTKFAVYEEENELFRQTVHHPVHQLKNFLKIVDQFQYRLDLILSSLKEKNIRLSSLSAVVGRGGLLKPVKGGTYLVNEQMVQDLIKAKRGEHASNLGAVMAKALADEIGVPAFIVDPVTVDEMEPVARLTGLPELERESRSHALNTRAVGRKVARDMGKSLAELNFIVAHLGSGFSITPLYRGKMIDVTDVREEGPFSVDRAGGLPVNKLVKLCFSGKYTYQELKEILSGKSGVYAYLGTTDIVEVERMAASGNQKAHLVLNALTYQVAKQIGAMATVLEGDVDRIIITGGLANSQRIVNDIIRRVKFIAPVEVIPGERELEALALGALRVLRGEEEALEYV
ncbi:MAG: butyrate kinase [Clostridia bacterium]|nr:butyrate kinase [Clostridia bacterium]